MDRPDATSTPPTAADLERLTGLTEPGDEEWELHGPGLGSPETLAPVAAITPSQLPGDVDPTAAVAGLGGEAAFVLALAGYVRRRRSRRRAAWSDA
jgi:hypothetical protein